MLCEARLGKIAIVTLDFDMDYPRGFPVLRGTLEMGGALSP